MKITKFGHCCLLLEINSTRVLIDPGSFTQKGTAFEDIDLILISHSHSDHLDIGLLKLILENNKPVILTNAETAAELTKNGIESQIINENEEKSLSGVKIKAYGQLHHEVYPGVSAGANTAFMINDSFFYPGDSYLNPGINADILAMPVAGPWVKLSEAIDYCLQIKPRICFPIHDGNMLTPGAVYSLPEAILAKSNIKFTPLNLGTETKL